MPLRQPILEGAHNIRDLGGHPCRDGSRTMDNRIYRGCAMTGLTAKGLETLRALGLVAVIDLRGPGEQRRAPCPLRDMPRWMSIPLFDGLAPLAPGDAATLGAPLAARYIAAAQTNAARFAEVVRSIAAAPEGSVLIHCSAGKDRTGLIAAIMLSLAGATEEAIVEDYLLTGTLGAPLLERLRVSALDRGFAPHLLDQLLAARARDIEAFLEWIRRRHGEVHAYLHAAGCSHADIIAAGRRLRAA